MFNLSVFFKIKINKCKIIIIVKNCILLKRIYKYLLYKKIIKRIILYEKIVFIMFLWETHS